MAKKKKVHYAESNGRPLAFDKNLGVLLPADHPTTFPGFRGLRQLNKIIGKTMEIRVVFEKSVLFDSGRLAPLYKVGVIHNRVLQ